MVVHLAKGVSKNLVINIMIFRKELLYFIGVSGLVYSLFQSGYKWVDLPVLPVAMLGTALSILLGFRNGSAYDRWWEARKIWGGIINMSRTLAVQIETYSEDQNLIKNTIYRHLAYIHALRLNLRGQTNEFQKTVAQYISPIEWGEIENSANIPTQILRNQSLAFKQAAKTRKINSDFKLFELMGSIKELFDLQGKAERIKKTPFPKYYELYVNVFFYAFITLFPFSLVGKFGELSRNIGHNITWLIMPVTILVGFVFAAIDKSGSETEDPFENKISDTPMTAICIVIERDLRQMLGETEIPENLNPNEIGVIM
ncbi:MAG: bestrophin family protein [Saprospiraceae bacterium]|nr:bestrophin family protein [Saprospiraceae bacterium]